MKTRSRWSAWPTRTSTGRTRFITSNDPEVVEKIAVYYELGFHELVLHAPGPDQTRFLDQFGEDVLPLLRERLA